MNNNNDTSSCSGSSIAMSLLVTAAAVMAYGIYSMIKQRQDEFFFPDCWQVDDEYKMQKTLKGNRKKARTTTCTGCQHSNDRTTGSSPSPSYSCRQTKIVSIPTKCNNNHRGRSTPRTNLRHLRPPSSSHLTLPFRHACHTCNAGEVIALVCWDIYRLRLLVGFFFFFFPPTPIADRKWLWRRKDLSPFSVSGHNTLKRSVGSNSGVHSNAYRTEVFTSLCGRFEWRTSLPSSILRL